MRAQFCTYQMGINNFYERQRNLHKTESATQTTSSERQSTKNPTRRHEFWRLRIFLLLRQPDAKKHNRIMSMIILQHLTQKGNEFFFLMMCCLHLLIKCVKG